MKFIGDHIDNNTHHNIRLVISTNIWYKTIYNVYNKTRGHMYDTLWDNTHVFWSTARINTRKIII